MNTEEKTGFELAMKDAAKNSGYESDLTSVSGESGTASFANLEAAKAAQAQILETVSNTKQAELEIQDIIKTNMHTIQH